MGHIWIEVDISNPIEKTKTKTIHALVDTGATLTVIPKSFADEIDIKPHFKDIVETGAGPIEIEKGRALIKIGEKEEIQTVWISDIIDKVLIGVVTLQVVGLKVNPITGKIEETPLMLYSLNK